MTGAWQWLPLPTRREAAWGGLTLALTIAYGGAFAPWRWLTETLPPTAAEAVPPALALVLFAAALPRLRSGGRARVAWLVAAVALAGAGLLIPDPAFAAKRVHVFQYALLALVTRGMLASRLSGATLVIAAALTAALLGIHDELLQGLRPERSFGLGDILVNGIAAAAGGCLGVALAGPRRGADGAPISAGGWAAIALALSALAIWLAALTRFGVGALPDWAWLPLPLALLLWPLLSTRGRRWPAALPVWLAAAAIVEPLVARLADIPFE